MQQFALLEVCKLPTFYLVTEWGNSFICREGSLAMISHSFLRSVLFIRSYLTVDSHLLIHKCARAEPFRLSLYVCFLWKLMPINRWSITWTEINVTNMFVLKILFVPFQFLMMVHLGSWWASVEPFLCLTEVCIYYNFHFPHNFPKLHEKIT